MPRGTWPTQNNLHFVLFYLILLLLLIWVIVIYLNSFVLLIFLSSFLACFDFHYF